MARSTFLSQNAQNTPWSDHFWKLRCQKSARRCGAKHISKWKCTKRTMLGPLLQVEMSKKCTALWREAHFEVNMYKTLGVRTPLLEVQMSFRVAGARDCAPLQKWAKCEGFVAFPKTMAGMGHSKRICKDAFSVAGAVQKTSSWEMLGGQGADFLRGVAFWGIRCAGLLRWFCVTGAALRTVWPGINFLWQAQYFRQVDWKNRKTHWYEAVSSPFPFLKEVSQNSFVFDVFNFDKWGSLAELLRFGRCYCYVQTLRKSRRISSFLILQIDR